MEQAQEKNETTSYDLAGTTKRLRDLHTAVGIHFVSNWYSSTAHVALQCLDGMEQRITDQKGHIAQLTREYNEIRDAYMEVSEKNTHQAKQLAALRIAVRELAGKDPVPPGTTEAAQEVTQPKGSPEKPFAERRGCDCGCGVSVTILKEDELPAELQEILKQLRSHMK